MQDSNRRATRSITMVGLLVALSCTVVTVSSSPGVLAADTRVPAGQVFRISVPDAIGGKTVIGQLTVDNATAAGYVTAYGCADGIPLDATGRVTRSDLNYDGAVAGVWSNRLIAQADRLGELCFYTHTSVDMIVDVNGVSFDTGITSFPNRRIDTRNGTDTELGPVAAGGVLRLRVPEAVGAKTVVGQLTTDGATDVGFVTAFACDLGVPAASGGAVTKSDLNFDPAVGWARSNRLIVQADEDGDICFHTSRAIDLIVDVNGVTDSGISSFPNRRTDTRTGDGSQPGSVAAGQTIRISVPESVGGATVLGQLTVDRAITSGFVTAFGCDDGLPSDAGRVVKSDLNYDGGVAMIWSNRLIVQADEDGDICLYTSDAVDLVVDLNGVASDIGIFSFPNQRTDTRTRAPFTSVPVDAGGVPVWPPFTPASDPMVVGALTGEPVGPEIAARPIVAVKIDNYRRARPQFGLEQADAIIEENVEGITRFVALFQTRLPDQVGPVRSARTSDLDLVSGMNRPVFGYSGANAGVTTWIRSAAASGVVVDFSALRSPCYRRDPVRPAPHNLILDASCATTVSAAAGPAAAPGRAGSLWAIDATWTPPTAVRPVPDTSFSVPMDGVRVEWAWDASTGAYLRSQDGNTHLSASGERITARNVVEVVAKHVPSPVDARSPNPITVGDGVAIVHRAGVAIRGTWSRATAYDPFVFRDALTGGVIPLDTGRTFIELTRG